MNNIEKFQAGLAKLAADCGLKFENGPDNEAVPAPKPTKVSTNSAISWTLGLRIGQIVSLLMACAILSLSGCASTSTTTPVAPTPPQLTVANSVAVLASSTDAAAHALATGLANGTVSQGDFNTGKSIITALATAGQQIDAEQRSADPWATQQSKIITIITANGLAQISAHVSQTVALAIAAAVAAANQISISVGGPTI